MLLNCDFACSACSVGPAETATVQPDSSSQPADRCAVSCEQSCKFCRFTSDVTAWLRYSAAAAVGDITGLWHAAATAASPIYQLRISSTTIHSSCWPGKFYLKLRYILHLKYNTTVTS